LGVDGVLPAGYIGSGKGRHSGFGELVNDREKFASELIDALGIAKVTRSAISKAADVEWISVDRWLKGVSVPQPATFEKMLKRLALPEVFENKLRESYRRAKWPGQSAAIIKKLIAGSELHAVQSTVPIVDATYGGDIRHMPVDVEHTAFPEGNMESREILAFRVHGEALLPRFKPGDILIATTAREARAGDLVLFRRNGRVECLVYGGAGRKVELRPINPQTPTIVCAKGDIDFMLPVVTAHVKVSETV
jgi:SOS-response transcriptional repressor LexA